MTRRKEISVDALVATLWAARRRLAASVFVGLVCALMYIVGARKEYTSQVTLLPEERQETLSLPGLDLLQQFGGALGGIDLSRLSGGEQRTVSPALYPQVLASTPVLLELLQQPVPFDGGALPLGTYLEDHKPFSLWEGMAGLPSEAMAWIRGEPEPLSSSDSLLVSLSTDTWKLIEDLRERLSARFDPRDGLLTVEASLPDPRISATMTAAVVRALTEFAAAYRTDKLREDLAFVKARYEEARGEFESAQLTLAEFQDTNRNMARNVAQARELQLQAQYDLAFSVYTSLANRYQEAEIRVQEEQPIFHVLQPATVPIRKSSPRTIGTLILGLLVGLMAGLTWTLVLAGTKAK